MRSERGEREEKKAVNLSERQASEGEREGEGEDVTDVYRARGRMERWRDGGKGCRMAEGER